MQLCLKGTFSDERLDSLMFTEFSFTAKETMVATPKKIGQIIILLYAAAWELGARPRGMQRYCSVNS